MKNHLLKIAAPWLILASWVQAAETIDHGDCAEARGGDGADEWSEMTGTMKMALREGAK